MYYFNPRFPCGKRPRGPADGLAGGPISIHAPRVGSVALWLAVKCASTYFNPRSPCGERHLLLQQGQSHLGFQSTLPVWGASEVGCTVGIEQIISIHAPRVGSVPECIPTGQTRRDFNPRSPCGERHAFAFLMIVLHAISIHAPRVGSVGRTMLTRLVQPISIHAPRVGSVVLPQPGRPK